MVAYVGTPRIGGIVGWGRETVVDDIVVRGYGGLGRGKSP
jgi:hypothetical protein